MKRNSFKKLDTRTINGKRTPIMEHVNLAYFKIGSCNIPAKTVDEAVAKYVECQAKRTVQL